MKKVYVKEQACIGCRLCEVYCRLAHSGTKDLLKAFKQQTPPLSRIHIEKEGTVSFSLRCQHCAEAPCLSACLTGAVSRDPATGAVIVDEERCIGCGTCILVCPFGAVHYDTGRGKVAKCDLCQGQETPACVENCPNEALVYEEEAEVAAGENVP